MKRTHAYVFIGAVLLLFTGVSCIRDGTVVPDEGSTFTVSSISAVYPPIVSGEGTKSEAGAVTYRTYWNAGDKLAIINVTQGNRIDTYTSQAKVENNYDGAGRFDADGSYTYNAGDVVFAVYPYAAIAGIEDGSSYKVRVQLTDNLNYTSKTNSPMFSQNDIQVSNMVSASSLLTSGTKYPGIAMNRMIAMIRVLSHVSHSVITSERVNSVTVAVKGIAGEADIFFTGKTVGSTPSLSLNPGTNDTFTVNLTNRPTVGSSTTIAEFIPVFPFSLKNEGDYTGFSVIYNTDVYEIGFHREAASGKLNPDAVMAFNVFEGAYTQVISREQAVGDYKWWYTLRTGGMDRAGGFEGESEADYGGSTAGGFTE